MTACAGIKGKLIIVGQCKLYYQGLRKEKGKVGVEFILFCQQKKAAFAAIYSQLRVLKRVMNPHKASLV